MNTDRYARSYGYRYNELGDRPSTKQIAAAIRSDIKQAQDEGMLPTRWTYSVRSRSFSGGSAIDVRVKDCQDAWMECNGTVPGSERTVDGITTATACHNYWCAATNDSEHAQKHEVLTEEAQVAKLTLQRIHDAYNHDGSDSMTDYFDVRYYGQVEFQSLWSAEYEEKDKAHKAAKAAAKATMKPTGLFTNYNRKGDSTTHLVAETDEGQKMLACGARLSSRSLFGYEQKLEAQPITCSRCSKFYAKGGK